MVIRAWRMDQTSKYKYTVQINDISFKEKKIVNFLFKDWKETGNGWNAYSKNEIKILNKEFSSEDEWLNWAKKFPLKLIEIKFRNGKEKYVQHSCKTRKKRE